MNFIKSLVEKVIIGIGKIHWSSSTQISAADQEKIKELLVDNYFVILSHRKNHLSTFFVGLANFVLTFKWGYWSHALMNLEDEVQTKSDFRIVGMNDRALIEATGEGVHITPFDKVFDAHGIALLKPKSMTLDEWTAVLDKAKDQIGKPYDTLFDLADDKALSCVELVRVILQAQPNYETDFANFEALIKKRKNLTPSMFVECPDFGIVYKVRR
jgi:hypothetical protein